MESLACRCCLETSPMARRVPRQCCPDSVVKGERRNGGALFRLRAASNKFHIRTAMHTRSAAPTPPGSPTNELDEPPRFSKASTSVAALLGSGKMAALAEHGHTIAVPLHLRRPRANSIEPRTHIGTFFDQVGALETIHQEEPR